MLTDAQRKAVRHLARIAAQKLLEQDSAPVVEPLTIPRFLLDPQKPLPFFEDKPCTVASTETKS
jgi:hypothetical protein